jgi:hypothetical protein
MNENLTNLTPKKQLMLEALRSSLGIVTTACLSAGISRESHYNWLKDDPEYKRSVEALDDVVLDFAESQLHKRINEGSDTATIFFLKTKGKKRGYIEKQEITNTNLNVEVQEVTEEMQNELLNTLKRMIE